MSKDNWFNNIPSYGVLCKVCKFPKKPTIRLVVAYHEGRFCPFETDNGKYYETAKPLTQKEIILFYNNEG